jgi:two-component system sensor histidine kinase RegB
LVGLFMRHAEMPELGHTVFGRESDNWTFAQIGFVVAFAACSGTVCYFITRVTRELRRRESELRLAEQRRARSERLEALATLAAGAGHELASPLSTIAVIANDLNRHLQGTSVPISVVEDVRLIRGELDHCKEILDRLASSAGQTSGEVMSPIRVGDLVSAVVESLRRSDRVDVELATNVAREILVVPKVGISQAIRGLVRNALDAGGKSGRVRLCIDKPSPRWCRMLIIDQGPGMPADVLARAGEPFFTTKEPGKGMGLGIFLARNVVERLGGRFSMTSKPNQGTLVSVELTLVVSSSEDEIPAEEIANTAIY